jgi:hypothetical protein
MPVSPAHSDELYIKIELFGLPHPLHLPSIFNHFFFTESLLHICLHVKINMKTLSVWLQNSWQSAPSKKQIVLPRSFGQLAHALQKAKPVGGGSAFLNNELPRAGGTKDQKRRHKAGLPPLCLSDG